MKGTGMYRNIISILVICLLITSMVHGAGAASSDSVTISGYILPHQAPHADFTASPRSGSTPLTVQFTDTSSESPTAWSWDFQNDGTVDSHAKNPSYTYTHTGTYSVKLRATNAFGSDNEIKSAYILVTSPGPGARITALRQYANGLSIPTWSKWLLTTPLRNAEDSLDRGNKRTAVLYMRAFIENVRLIRWMRIITASQSNYMISEANAIVSIIET